MTKPLLVSCMLLSVMACTRVVTTTTQEVRPMRYALLEVTHRLATPDSALAYARRALAAEQIPLQPNDAATGGVTGGPVHFAADGELPGLNATVTITATTLAPETRFRVYASAVLAADQVGGVDPRLTALAQRISKRIESLIAQ